MRIISGDLKGRKLLSARGMATRPTSDRVREALFNILGPKPIGAHVLDLYAGTGALGIEALSRGADRAIFIDRSAQALTTLRKNLGKCNLTAVSQVIQWDITKNLNCLKHAAAPFDLIFLDPPYNKKLVATTLSHLLAAQCSHTDTIVVAEHESGLDTNALPSGLKLENTRRYGKTALSFFSLVCM